MKAPLKRWFFFMDLVVSNEVLIYGIYKMWEGIWTRLHWVHRQVATCEIALKEICFLVLSLYLIKIQLTRFCQTINNAKNKTKFSNKTYLYITECINYTFFSVFIKTEKISFFKYFRKKAVPNTFGRGRNKKWAHLNIKLF